MRVICRRLLSVKLKSPVAAAFEILHLAPGVLEMASGVLENLSAAFQEPSGPRETDPPSPGNSCPTLLDRQRTPRNDRRSLGNGRRSAPNGKRSPPTSQRSALRGERSLPREQRTPSGGERKSILEALDAQSHRRFSSPPAAPLYQ